MCLPYEKAPNGVNGKSAKRTISTRVSWSKKTPKGESEKGQLNEKTLTSEVYTLPRVVIASDIIQKQNETRLKNTYPI